MLLSPTADQARPIDGMQATCLKGGSLSGTYLVSDRGLRFVRKDVSTIENREYGFYRWFSQLKKLQRLHHKHPDLFPAVLNVDADASRAWYDLEYVSGAVTLDSFLAGPRSDAEIEAAFAAFMTALDRLHAPRIPSFASALHLYLCQEVDRALHFCLQDAAFLAFSRHPTLTFNGVRVPSLLQHLTAFQELADRHATNAYETDTHGNVTLENTLYLPEEQRIVFIDLYEENFVDNIYNEYSQVLQSCSSCYELYNAGSAQIVGSAIDLRLAPHPALDGFDALFQRALRLRCTADELVLIRLYEVTQYTRMLPFKRQVAPDKLILFYGLASLLMDRLMNDL